MILQVLHHFCEQGAEASDGLYAACKNGNESEMSFHAVRSLLEVVAFQSLYFLNTPHLLIRLSYSWTISL
jgi:hypothetical protein